VEIRLNEDGSLDEIVGEGKFHLEQMDSDIWFLELDSVGLLLETDTGGRITATPRDYNAWSEAERVLRRQT